MMANKFFLVTLRLCVRRVAQWKLSSVLAPHTMKDENETVFKHFRVSLFCYRILLFFLPFSSVWPNRVFEQTVGLTFLASMRSQNARRSSTELKQHRH